MFDLDDLPKAVTVTERRSRFLRRPTGTYTFRCSHCDFTSVNLDEYDVRRLLHDSHPRCAERAERHAEVQAIIDKAKDSGTHYIICRGSVDGYGLWVYRCRLCGWMGPDLPWPESAVEEFAKHIERGSDGVCMYAADNPWHPDPAHRTKGY